LEETGRPNPIPEEFVAAREIDRYTLLGEFDVVYLSLLASWILENGLSLDDEAQFNQCFTEHMNRGIELLSARTRSLGDMASLLPKLENGIVG
jgi:DNA sulfur modification protein DndE